jgi:hypothetical protein
MLIAFRFHAFDLPLETDECNYAYIGARLLAGDRLYVDVWDHQPPGAFMLFAAAIALFGDDPMVYRWMACGCSLATLLLILLILRRLLVNNGEEPTASSRSVAAIVGAALFAMVSADPGTAGEGCQREIYMNTLILLAWYAAIRATDRPESSSNSSPAVPVYATWCFAGWWLLAGVSLGTASLFKTVVAVHWLGLVLWMLVCVTSYEAQSTIDNRQSLHMGPRERKLAARCGGWTRRWIALGALSVGPLIIWSSTFVHFAATDRWSAFIDAVFTFNLGYAGGASGLARWIGFFTPDRHPFIFDSAMPLWIAGAMAAIWLVFDGLKGHFKTRDKVEESPLPDGSGSDSRQFLIRRNSHAWLILTLVLAGYVAVCLPGRFWPHYYYLLIPPLVLAVSYALASVPRSFRIPHSALSISRPMPFVIQITLGLAVVGSALWTQYRDYLSQPPFGITVKRYNSRDFWGRGQGANVRRVTDPDDTIFVYGNDASIYYYARRRCASRYTMMTGLAEGMPGAERRRAILMKELRESMPRLIVVLFDYDLFDEWRDFLHERYTEPIGWDLHDRTRRPIMFVVARKDAPVAPIDWDWDRSSVGGWQLGEGR